MPAAFTLELRRLAGPEPRFAVRYSCRNGRAVLDSGTVWSVAEASLRSNGYREGMTTAEVLAGVFVFVGFELADNGKFQLWHQGALGLHALPTDGAWVAVSPMPEDRSPFFSLDTDELEFVRPWSRGAKRHPLPADPVTEPGVSRSRWHRPRALDSARAVQDGSGQVTPSTHSGFFDIPGLVEPIAEVGTDPACSSWDEREVLAMPALGLAERTRGIEQPGGEVNDLLRVVHYLRQELSAERAEGRRLQAQLAELRATVAALAEHSAAS